MAERKSKIVQLLQFLFEYDLMNYFEMMFALNDLCDRGQAARTKKGAGYLYAVTTAGVEALMLFGGRVPPSVYALLKKNGGEWKRRFRREAQNLAEIRQTDRGEYELTLRVVEQDMDMMRLSLSLPTRELADQLIPYARDMGYTHLELMPVMEHPFDGSWGYQVTGYFAPTSRYGTPEDFAYMVNYLHRHNIGVILDWVPAHFPRDAHGLAEFDGTPCYEYADPRKGEHPDWGTKVFDFGKSEVKNFLIGNALFWIEQFHVDGLRVDAVASILYLDYGRRDGEWVANEYGGNKNLEAIEFFKHLNSVVRGKHHGVMMIAEESTAWPKVTDIPENDGLGFSMKWNMGWMHDFLEYMKLDPYFRKFNHNKMTFAMTYAYSEKYCLVLSHDEVVHLKCSMLNKMPGYYSDKFANLKAAYAFMFGHPGKKLLFMGQEFAQEREWSEDRELDWFLLDQPEHRQMQDFTAELLQLYKSTPALYDADCVPAGFEWINADDADRSIYSFLRHSADGKSNLLFVINFTPMARPDYRVGCVKKGTYRLVLDGDEERFGGAGTAHPESYKAVESECDGKPYSFAYDLPPYGVAVFRYR